MEARSSGRHALVALSGQWTKYAVQIVALVVFSRLLDPTDFGILAMVAAVVGVGHVLGDFGLSLAALQAVDLTPGQRSNLFWLTTAIGALLTAVVCAISPALAGLYDESRVTGVACAVSVVFLLNGLAGQFRTELNRERRFVALAAADATSQVAGLAVGVLVVVAGGDYWALVAQQVTAAAGALAVAVAAARWWPGRYQRGERMGSLLRFGGLTLAAQLVNYASSNADALLIGRTWGPAVLGVYSRGYQVARLPVQQVAAPLTRVVLPELAGRATDPAAFGAAVRRAQLTLSATLLGLLGFVAAAADPLVEVVLGPGWSDAVPVVRALCLAGAFQACGYTFYWVLLAHGRAGVLFGSELGARLAMVALMVVAVPHGPVWVALAAAAGQLLLLASGALVAMPRVGLGARDLLAVSARPAVLFGWAAAATAYADSRLGGDLPVAGALALAAAVWTVCCAVALVVPAYRRDLRELLTTLTAAVRGSAR